jgi:AhpC/TSA family/Thiol:disulfide interchange protein DsbD, N-terminal
VELQHNLGKIQAQGLGVAAISYDSRAVLEDFATRRGITYPLLSDPDSSIIRSFGILNEAVPNKSPFFGVPYPGTYIVSPEGVVTAKYFAEDYRERDTASEILARQFGLSGEGERVTAETKHVNLTSSASAEAARPGQRVALILDLELKPKMHVYAPGVTGYIPVEWSLESNPAVTADPVEYPPGRVIELPVINEKVPVYTSHVRLIREITLKQNASTPLVIKGAFRYQACDDTQCYIPVTLPLEWTIRVEPLDRERVPAALQRKPPR